jgi:hypothetical protein
MQACGLKILSAAYTAYLIGMTAPPGKDWKSPLFVMKRNPLPATVPGK